MIYGMSAFTSKKTFPYASLEWSEFAGLPSLTPVRTGRHYDTFPHACPDQSGFTILQTVPLHAGPDWSAFSFLRSTMSGLVGIFKFAPLTIYNKFPYAGLDWSAFASLPPAASPLTPFRPSPLRQHGRYNSILARRPRLVGICICCIIPFTGPDWLAYSIILCRPVLIGVCTFSINP